VSAAAWAGTAAALLSLLALLIVLAVLATRPRETVQDRPEQRQAQAQELQPATEPKTAAEPRPTVDEKSTAVPLQVAEPPPHGTGQRRKTAADFLPPLIEPGSLPVRELAKPAAPLDLLDLMDKGRVEVKVGYACISFVAVTVDFRGKAPTAFHVSAGTYFASADPRYQDLVTVEDVPVPAEGLHDSVRLPTCCTNRAKAAPNSPRYSIRRLEKGSEILRLARRMAELPEPIHVKQSRVWEYTDRLRARK
jgi:hypothetical protein